MKTARATMMSKKSFMHTKHKKLRKLGFELQFNELGYSVTIFHRVRIGKYKLHRWHHLPKQAYEDMWNEINKIRSIEEFRKRYFREDSILSLPVKVVPYPSIPTSEMLRKYELKAEDDTLVVKMAEGIE